MKILELFKKQPKKAKRKQPLAHGGTYQHMFAVSYDGEKNFGEMGPIREYQPNYELLRLRSWQAYLDSEICQTVINKFVTWIIGSGLKLQADPVKAVLRSEKIDVETEEFNKVVEARFKVFSGSKRSDYSNMKNLHMLAKEAIKNAIIGGDVLVIDRYINGELKRQLIDGAHVKSPVYGNDYFAAATKRGTKIRHGIELSPTGEHVAYYVLRENLEYERIPAKTRNGQVVAQLIYGLRYRLDNHRGLPLICAILETAKKLERYKEATVGSAEEVAKIVYQIVHQHFSTGDTPFTSELAKAFNADATEDLPTDSDGTELANTVAATTNKQTYNMPVGSKMEAVEHKNSLYFKDFYSVNIDLICATLGIPPNVAMSKYDSNFSASRAALKDWEHTINVNRVDFSYQYYQPFYNLWLETEILKSKVQAPGYLTAAAEKNNMVIDAYRNARFTGTPVPHIDPVKEVEAERRKLGDKGGSIPLTTVEAATEALNGGDSDSNMAQYSKELEEAENLKIATKDPVTAPLNRP